MQFSLVFFNHLILAPNVLMFLHAVSGIVYKNSDTFFPPPFIILVFVGKYKTINLEPIQLTIS